MKTMKTISLGKIIKKECKNKKFKALFQKELLINEIAKMAVELRRQANFTQKELATKAGTTQPVIARLESGTDKRMPSLELLAKLAIAADATIKITISRNANI